MNISLEFKMFHSGNTFETFHICPSFCIGLNMVQFIFQFRHPISAPHIINITISVVWGIKRCDLYFGGLRPDRWRICERKKTKCDPNWDVIHRQIPWERSGTSRCAIFHVWNPKCDKWFVVTFSSIGGTNITNSFFVLFLFVIIINWHVSTHKSTRIWRLNVSSLNAYMTIHTKLI